MSVKANAGLLGRGELLAKCGLGEQASGATGCRDITPQNHLRAVDLEPLAQQARQLSQAGELATGERSAIAVAHQANADGLVVEQVGVGARNVDAWELVAPAVAHMDLPVTHSMAVADHKVVAQTRKAPLLMLAGDRVG